MKFNTSKSFLAVVCLITAIGVLLPWKCSGDISWDCPAGIQVYSRFDHLDFFQPINFILLIFLVIVNFIIINSLILESKTSLQLKTDLFVLLDCGLVFWGLMQNGIVKDNGGALIPFLSFICFWTTIRADSQYKNIFRILGLASTIAAIVLLVYSFVQLVSKQLAEIHISGGTELRPGIVIALFGMLVILFKQLLHRVEENIQEPRSV